MPSEDNIVSIQINYQQFDEQKLFRLKKFTGLRIVPGESLLGRNIIVRTNYDDSEFVRTSFSNLNWFTRQGDKLSSSYEKVRDVEMYCEVHLKKSGSFLFQIVEESTGDPCGSIYVQIEPEIHIGSKGETLKLESIRCQTVLSKCLGPLSTWEAKLRVAKECGYNLIHFTPVQQLGFSRSAYCLSDQLKLDHTYGNVSYADAGKVVQKIRKEWGIASICDIVLNHTANESEWLKDHPDAAYSCENSPHLRTAFLIDAILLQVGADVNSGLLDFFGIPAVIENEDHIQALKHQLLSIYLPKLRIHEFYQVDIQRHFAAFSDALRTTDPFEIDANYKEVKFTTLKDYRRFNVTVDVNECLKIFNIFRSDCFDNDSRMKKCSELFYNCLSEYNNKIKSEIDDLLNYAVENALAGVRYERVQNDGPKFRTIEFRFPLFTPYFTHTGTEGKSLEEIEEMVYNKEGAFFMAHNGWVMGHDPLIDFAKYQPGIGNVYLKRELIAWGDSVKLRYGDKPEDSPYLWQRMKDYVDTTAKYFDGVRLDNCHSTPLHVAEFLIDSARQVNPDLYVVAELFTNKPETDNIFVNRLGITSLIREALSAWDSHEQGRLVYLYGGDPIGRFFNNLKRPLNPSIAHAILFDQTHDNQSFIEKRSIYDQIPSAGMVAMACCATGSNRGFDELVPHHIHVVNEARNYQAWGKEVNEDSGIIAARNALNEFHGFLSQGFDQIFVDQMHPDIVAITRQNPTTLESYILVAHTCFSKTDNFEPTSIRPLRFEGKISEIYLEITLEYNQHYAASFEKDPHVMNGIENFNVDIQKNIELSNSKIFSKTAILSDEITQLDFVNLRPGCVVVVKASPHTDVSQNIANLQNTIKELSERKGPHYESLKSIIKSLNLVDMNFVLFSCNQEESDRGLGFGAYDFPEFKRLEYAGLQGVISMLLEVAPSNDLGHPLCNNLRQGNWLIDYISDRLTQTNSTMPLSQWLKNKFTPLKKISRYLIPAYFDAIITKVYDLLIEGLLDQMPSYVSRGSSFSQLLAIASLQFLAPVKSSPLPDLSPFVSDPKPPQLCTTLAAGLEHFATGYMRCWGRDTFISLRGLTFITGRFDEARYIILAFGGAMRHGLIPNLLDGGKNARYNCRDAIWFWLHCITCYCQEAPEGVKILKEKVARLYPNDESEAMPADGNNDQDLFEVMQETLHTHFQGLVFRERNAGTRIDAHMVNAGFNNQIGINPETGFVFGGNDANCGTWMDKMGSSTKAKNKGVPSSPRDGSAVELVGLQYAVLQFLSECKAYPYKAVTRTNVTSGSQTTWTFAEWCDRIKSNFEDKFFVKEDETSSLAHKHCIYKDTFGASKDFADYQLRCNFPISMVVAPDIFDPEHAWQALDVVKNKLLGPLGMKTLDPDDWNYRPNYDNSNDGDDPKVAHGFNYHQGPEWLWPVGFFIRARVHFAKNLGKLKEAESEIWEILANHLKELRSSPWKGLPELTNENGAFCRDSCRTQAWSIATILEALHDLENV